MAIFVTGILVLAGASAVLWGCMPKNGKVRPFVSTKVAPYIAVAVTMGLLVGFGTMLIGLVRLLSNA